MSHVYSIVQQQVVHIQALQERIAVLESRLNPTDPVNREKKTVNASRCGTSSSTSSITNSTNSSSSSTNSSSNKKRGRKSNQAISLSLLLHEDEQILVRVPLGARTFDESTALFKDGTLVLEDGQTFENPSTLVSAIAKMLEDVGERSTDCSRSLNGWTLCSVSRDGKRLTLDSLRAGAIANNTTNNTANNTVDNNES